MGFVKQVNCAPNESITWEKLTDPYIDLSQYEFTLNLCSMSTLDSRCMHHSLPAPKILLPSHRTNTELPEQETASVGHAENIGTSLCKRVRDPFKLRLGKRKQDRCCIWFDSRGFLTSDYRDAVGVVYGSAWGMCLSTCTPLVLISLNTHAGSSRVDNFPRWSGSFQDSACCVSQWNGTSRLYHGEGAKEAYQRCLDTARCVSSAFAAVIFRRYLSCIIIGLGIPKYGLRGQFKLRLELLSLCKVHWDGCVFSPSLSLVGLIWHCGAVSQSYCVGFLSTQSVPWVLNLTHAMLLDCYSCLDAQHQICRDT